MGTSKPTGHHDAQPRHQLFRPGPAVFPAGLLATKALLVGGKDVIIAIVDARLCSSMGLSLTWEDFQRVLRQPGLSAWACCCKYG
ncbi:hypothetical protein [Alcanivorax sp.]|uniref:hypothetical protein n=1 Tax=Alcanivorax sp. TaxID=1872427 RepID=UPI0025BEE24B|nr:hypothetical protein [Alcanivorax sp.]